MIPCPEKAFILIVEDSPASLAQLKRRLEQDFQYEILTAETYADAEQLMLKYGPNIFISVLDLYLPDADNGEVVDLAGTYDVPCIVCTSVVSPDIRKRIFSKQVVDYVVKGRNALDEVAFTVNRLERNCYCKVLVVEDSRSVRTYVRSLLELYMFMVVEAESGEQALKVLEEEPDIGLVITDYEMGDMNGVELTSAIRSIRTRDELAIIGVSSRSDKALSVQFIKQGANDYLDKPFEKEEFFCRVLKNVESVEDRIRLRELDELKNRFLGMAAHDLRNPINAIKGFSSLMLAEEGGGLRPDFVEMTEFIHKAAIQMNDLVSDLLDMAVIESGQLELELAEQNVAEVVEERVHMLRIRAERKQISIVAQVVPIHAVVDRDRIVQVLDNLLSNAIKFSSSETTVTITLGRDESHFVLTVADQGQGIPAEDLDKLFDSFQKLSPRPTAGETSTGLGLAIVKKVVEAHQGTISVHSVQGEGATFTVSIPMEQRACQPVSFETSPAHPAQ